MRLIKITHTANHAVRECIQSLSKKKKRLKKMIRKLLKRKSLNEKIVDVEFKLQTLNKMLNRYTSVSDAQLDKLYKLEIKLGKLKEKLASSNKNVVLVFDNTRKKREK